MSLLMFRVAVTHQFKRSESYLCNPVNYLVKIWPFEQRTLPSGTVKLYKNTTMLSYIIIHLYFLSPVLLAFSISWETKETYLLRSVEQMTAAENERRNSAERRRNAQLCLGLSAVGFVHALLSYGIIIDLLYSDTNEWRLLLLLIAEFPINYQLLK